MRTARIGLGEGIALGGALCWSILLLVGAYLVPVYQGSESTTRGPHVVQSRETSATLVEVNGDSALLVLAVPVVVTVLVALALLAWERGQLPAAMVAFGLVALLGVFNALALLSIGIFIAPVTACLILACCLHMGSR